MAADPIRLHEDKLPIGACSLCGADIMEVRLVGSWDDRVRGFGAWYSGRCPVCDVDFQLAVERTTPGAWRIDAPDASQLLSVLTEAEIETLSRKIDRYPIKGAKWQSFLARRRPGDEVWRFNSDEGRTGITVVRRGRPIARFDVFGNL